MASFVIENVKDFHWQVENTLAGLEIPFPAHDNIEWRQKLPEWNSVFTFSCRKISESKKIKLCFYYIRKVLIKTEISRVSTVIQTLPFLVIKVLSKLYILYKDLTIYTLFLVLQYFINFQVMINKIIRDQENGSTVVWVI